MIFFWRSGGRPRPESLHRGIRAKGHLFLFLVAFAALGSVLVHPAAFAQASVLSPFTKCEKEELSGMKFEDLACDWFELPIITEHKMFNPVFLPFGYKSDLASPDPMQPYTFPFLLSLRFDWVPDNISRSHPFHVYGRSQKLVKALATEKERLLGWLPVLKLEAGYKRTLVREYAMQWAATHAIGGEIRETEQGWGGAMVVYDASGELVLAKSYPENLGYFELMARMVENWMQHRGQTVSKGLSRELRRPMTNSATAIRVLGNAAFVPRWTDTEWEVYDEVLKLDPAFAEVRWWYANQREWADRDKVKGALGRSEALKLALVVPAIREFESDRCSDQRFVTSFPELVEHAAQMCPNHCQIMPKLLEARYGKVVPVNKLVQLDALYVQCPHYDLLNEVLCRSYQEHFYYEKAIPIRLSDIWAGTTYGYGSNWGAYWGNLGVRYGSLGHFRQSVYCASAGLKIGREPGEKRVCWFSLAQGLGELFHFESAGKASLECFKVSGKAGDLGRAVLWFHEANQPDQAQQLESQYRDNIKATGWYPVTRARALLAKGLFKEALRTLDGAENLPDYPYHEGSIVFAEIGLLAGDPQYRSKLNEVLLHTPTCRVGWVLLDGYNRRWPKEEDDYFYYALPRLFPRDKWLRAAVNENLARRGRRKVEYERLADTLQAGVRESKSIWDVARVAFAGEAAILWLAEEGRYQGALQLCRAYERQLDASFAVHAALAHRLTRFVEKRGKR